MADGGDFEHPLSPERAPERDPTGSVGLDRFISHLDARLDAAVAREEEAAGDDLGITLDQDRTLDEVLARRRASVVGSEGNDGRVVLVAADHVRTAREAYLRRDAVIYKVEPSGERIPSSPQSLLELLRSWARARATVAITTASGRLVGILNRARRDHLELITNTGTFLVPYRMIRSVIREV